jgi:Abnormal spindle-like microcephaly-assoc'd, ASPM-SPD-2-Hydin/HYDIN/CFA65/VesB-like, Ig-like domain/Beta-propeller repeat
MRCRASEYFLRKELTMLPSHPLLRHFGVGRFIPYLLLSLVLCAFVPGFTSAAFAEEENKSQTVQPARYPAALKTEGLPLAFEPNLKQADARYKFLAHQNGLVMGFLDHSIEVRLATKSGNADVLGISFEGSKSSVASPENLLPGRVNYLRGSDPSAFQRNVPTYARMRYSSLYPGTDLVFYGNGSRLEHDFVLAPGAEPHAIALRFTGMRHLQLTPAGDLLIEMGQASVEFHRPFAYQETSNGRVEVPVAYRVRDGRASFDVGAYDRSLPLIIDPVLDYSTFLGDAGISRAHIAVDAAGNTYITSLVFDANYPTTTGSFQPGCASCASSKPDVVVTKLSADGSGQVYSTFLGGSDYDEPFGLAVDSNGNAVVVGRTQSADFPVKNPASTPTVGFASFSAFVSSLSADGSALNYSTLLGNGFVLATSVAVDSAGNAYVTGNTNDATFPVTPGALHAVQNNTTGGGDPLIFLTKFLPTGALSYSALVGDAEPQNGGGGPIGSASVAVDASGNAYIYGNAGTLWPITPGVFQPTIPGALPYAAPFVTKVAPDGGSLVYSTFVGDGLQSITIVVNSAGEAILTGFGPNSDYPVTPDARVSVLPQFASTGWLTKLSSTGTALVYSSFLTGGALIPEGMTVDGGGNIWVVGRTSDFQFPLVRPFMTGIPQMIFSPTTGFMMEFDSTGKQLLFSSYFGSATQFSEVQDVAADGAGQIHVAGIAGSTLHTTPGTFHPLATGQPTASFGFAAKIEPNAAAPAVCLSTNLFTGLGFDPTRLGQSTTAPLVLTNCGTAPLSLSAAVSSDPVFTVDATQCTGPVAPNASCSLAITFTPVATITSSANVTLTTNTPLVVTVVPVSGTGVVPVISVPPDPINFDPALVGQAGVPRQLFIQNTGGAPLQIDVAHTVITGADFSFNVAGCTPPIAPGSDCALTINFTPQGPGTRSGSLTIASDDPAHPQVVINLSGVGITTFPGPTLTSMGRSTAPVGSTNLNIFLSGSNFFPSSVVHIAGQAQKTTFESATLLSVAVDPALLTAMSELPVTVVNSAPGGGESAPLTLTVYRQLHLNPSFVISVPSRKLLYASIPASATANPNTVIAIDPQTGATHTPIAVGNDPRALAASDDGSFLFVAAQGDEVIQRINLSTGQIDRTFAYPANSLVLSRPFSATMQTVPGSQTSLLVYFASTNLLGGVMELFNDAGLVSSVPDLSQFFGGVNVSDFAFTDAGTAYSLPFTSASPFFNVFTIDASGLHFTPVTGTNVGGNSTTGLELISDGKLLYTKAGQVWDPVAKTQVGSFSVTAINPTSFPNLHDMTMDTAAGQFFMVADQLNGPAVGLTAYNLTSLATTGTLNFTELNDPEPHNLVRWGATGFGFITTSATLAGEDLLLFRSGLSKNPTAPAVTLSGNIAGFSAVDVGTTSAAQSLSITNSGTAPLNIQSITATGDFAATTTCAASVAPSASCSVQVTFKPTASGARTGLLTIVDDANSGEIVIGLSGTGTAPTLTISPASGATTSATVTAGQPATYNLSIAATPGAAGTATLTCSGVPTNATCTISPSSLNLSSSTNAAFTVTVETQVVRTASLTFEGVKLASIGLAFLPPVALLLMKRRRVSYGARVCVLLLACIPTIALTGCGGGGSPPQPPVTQTFKTAPGTYTFTVTATTGKASVSQPLTLTVN